MGIDPDRGWAANYEILPGKEKILRELQEYAKDAPAIYLATDLDREGEAIAWHLREAIGGDPRRFKRVVFPEITKTAIKQAFDKPGDLDIDRVNAQQARRFLDRVVGFMLSPLLWSKVARGLSAGRVQSVATRLVVEREREIHQFNPVEYWELYADLLAGAPLRVQAVRYKGEPFKPVTQADCDQAVERLAPASYRVSELEDRPSQQSPAAPLITSTHAAGILREEDDGSGAAPLRGGPDHLHAHGLHQPERRGGGGVPRADRLGLRAQVPSRKAAGLCQQEGRSGGA